MTAIWTNPSSLMWTSPSALFWTATAPWTETWFGVVGSFDFGSGSYTISGSEEGVVGTLDSLCFASQPATNNIEFSSYVSAQSSSDPYATAALMVRNTLTPDSRCAVIGVSPENGINFTWRDSDGAAAQTTLGPSVAAPVWLRLVVSQTSVAGYSSDDDGVNWRLIGEATISFDTDYHIGFAASSNSSSLNTVTFTDLRYIRGVVQRSDNLYSWLRADDSVTYDGSSNVSLWTDRSSNGYNASQSEADNQPALVTNAVNGLPAIDFTPGGSGEFLQFPTGFDFTDGLSLFVVLNPTSLSAGQTILDFRNYSGSSSDQFGISEASSSGVTFYAYDGSTASSGTFSSALTASQFQLLEAVYDGSSSVTMYVNGISLGSASSLETLADVNRENNFIGQSGDGGNFFSGQIAEILIFSTNVDSGTREAIESYLLGKYSL